MKTTKLLMPAAALALTILFTACAPGALCVRTVVYVQKLDASGVRYWHADGTPVMVRKEVGGCVNIQPLP